MACTARPASRTTSPDTRRSATTFYVLAGGNAVNFLHGASVGAFIFPVQAEILAALSRLTSGDIDAGYHEVPDTDRRHIAETWLAHFNRRGGN